jgi:CheY-like chemotaxis protein
MTGGDWPIVIVDDDPDVPFLLEHLFRRAGIDARVIAAADLDAGIAALEESIAAAARGDGHLPLFIMIDLKLPTGSGLDLLDWLKARPELKAIPRIVLSCSADERDVVRAYSHGANGFLTKYPAADTFAELARLAREKHSAAADVRGEPVTAGL